MYNIMDQIFNLLNQEYISIILALLIALYGSRARIELPDFIKDLFHNSIFRVVFLSSLLVYKVDSNPQVAFTVAFVFVLTMYYLDKQQQQENFGYVSAYIKSNNL